MMALPILMQRTTELTEQHLRYSISFQMEELLVLESVGISMWMIALRRFLSCIRNTGQVR